MLRLLAVVITVLALAVPLEAQSIRKSLERKIKEQKNADATSAAMPEDVTVYSVKADGLPDDIFYVAKGTNLYQVWKDKDGSWESDWGLCETENANGKTRFVITWEDGSDEIGDLGSGIYTIKKHTSDEAQIGKLHKMREAKLPAVALPTLNASIKRSFQLRASKEILKTANANLAVAESGLTVKTQHAIDARGLLRRQRQIKELLDAKNAKGYLDAVN